MGPAIDPKLPNDRSWWPEKAYEIFREMVEAGNRVARLRWSELQQLEMTLHDIPSEQPQPPRPTVTTRQNAAPTQLLSPDPSYVPASVDQSYQDCVPSEVNQPIDAEYGFGFNSLLSSAEMTAMANSIEVYDAEWVSNAMVTHGIW